MLVTRFLGATAIAGLCTGMAVADGSGANRMVMIGEAGAANSTEGDLINPAGVNGFGVIAAGDFGYSSGDEIFLLNRDGKNTVLLRDGSSGNWATSGGPIVGETAVNGMDMAVAGDFGFSDGDEIFLLSKDGTNRTLIRQESDGAWGVAEAIAIGATAVNGFEIAVAGDFAAGEGDEIFLLNAAGANRTLVREPSTGNWATADAMAIGETAVNGFEIAVAGDFGAGEGDEIFLLNKSGANRTLVREESTGNWATADGMAIGETAVNGFEFAVAGDFGFGPGDEIFLLNKNGENRLLIREESTGNWATADSAAMAAAAVNGFTKAAAGRFTEGMTDSIYLLD